MEEEFVYFTENDGEIAYYEPDEEFDEKTAHIGYRLKLNMNRLKKKLRINVPEKAEGKTVELISIMIITPDPMSMPPIDWAPIEYLYIPLGVRELVFDDLKFLVMNGINVEISHENPYFTVYGHGIYSKDMTKLYHIFSAEELFEVPNGVLKICDNAGMGAAGIKRLVVPCSVISIGEYAFHMCRKLEGIDISARMIFSDAFSRCPKLSRARLDCGFIYAEAFRFCFNLEKLELMNTEEINFKAFDRCISLKDVRLPDTLRKIGYSAFSNTGIQELVIPAGVQKIESMIFGNNSGKPFFMTAYSKDGSLPFSCSDIHVMDRTTFSLLRSETGEVMQRFVILDNLDMIFTEHGVDFTKYDAMFGKCDLSNDCDLKNMFDAACVRLQYPYKMTEETREFLRHFTEEYAGRFLTLMIKDSEFDAEKVSRFPYLKLISGEELLSIADRSAEYGKTEITAVLMREMNKRRGRE